MKPKSRKEILVIFNSTKGISYPPHTGIRLRLTPHSNVPTAHPHTFLPQRTSLPQPSWLIPPPNKGFKSDWASGWLLRSTTEKLTFAE